MAPQQLPAERLRQELRDLDSQRRAVEEEIALLTERLNAPGRPGVKGSLLDKEGFPRADIDVHQVRRDRHHLICLTNDHKALSDKLAGLLADFHTATRSQANGGNGITGTSTSTRDNTAIGPAGNTVIGPAGNTVIGPAGNTVIGPAGNTVIGPAGNGRPAAAAATASEARDGAAVAATDDGGSASAPMEVDGEGAEAAARGTGTERREAGGVSGEVACGSSAGGRNGVGVCERGGAAGAEGGAAPLAPFALVDEVTEGSPAAAAGLQVGDLLCAFGDVAAAAAAPSTSAGAAASSSSPSPSSSPQQVLQRVAGVLAGSEGRPVVTRVLRQGAPLELSLTPQRWAGRGLLGCHLRPL